MYSVSCNAGWCYRCRCAMGMEWRTEERDWFRWSCSGCGYLSQWQPYIAVARL